MTTPAQSQQQTPPQPPSAAPPAIPPQTLAAMALPLAGLLLTAVSAAAVVAALKLSFKLHALFWLALLMVLGFVMAHPPQATGVTGSASGHVSRLNTARRAQFAIASTMRVVNAMLAARAHGEDAKAAGEAQMERERRYYQQHLDAMRQRAIAAAKVDMAAMEYGPLLGWKAVLDSHTSLECAAANGRNFYAGRPPYIGYPGAVHPACRCKPVRPWPGGKLLPGSGPRYARAA